METDTETKSNTTTKLGSIHPLAAAAAVAVILVSVTGIAAMTGALPNFNKSADPSADVATNSSASQPSASTSASSGSKKSSAKNSAMVASNGSNSWSDPGSTEAGSEQSNSLPAAPPCPTCGVIESIHPIQQQAPTSGVGAAAGAILGGILGHQVGAGNGKTLATVAGAVGGGFAGNAVERNRDTTTSYQVSVRMEDGSHHRLVMKNPQWKDGDQVLYVNGTLSPRG